MKRNQVLLSIFSLLFLANLLFSQEIRLNIVTSRGKTPVFADTVYNADIKANVATADGYFRVEFTTPKFEGAFNVPIDYKGKVGVDGRIQPSFLRKDAHYTGVCTIKREKDNLIMLTRSPKEVPELESEIFQGILSKEKRTQRFSGDFQYQAFTYDEQKFVKRDFIVDIFIDFPFTITWSTVSRKWAPESLPDLLPELPKVDENKPNADSSQVKMDSTSNADTSQEKADTTKEVPTEEEQ